MKSDPLDNPIWSSLAGTHAPYAIGRGEARRYPAEMTSLMALRAPTPQAFVDLQNLLGPGGVAPLFLAEPVDPPAPFTLVYSRDITQMHAPAPIAAPSPAASARMRPLVPADVSAMQALVDLTKPGPFGPRSIEFGDFFGIEAQGALVAMAGTRLRPQGATEISAVCTHPDHQGQGFGRALVAHIGRLIQARGEIAFLHVKTNNEFAVRAYRALGFTQRRFIHLRVGRVPD
jgi:ribosomal protein S18 acetylase RimI-like enzyme